MDKSEIKLLAALTLVLLIGLGTCLGPSLFLNWLMPVEQEEKLRKTSPDGRIDAVLFTRDAGATTGTAYFISLVERGDAPRADKANLVADGVNDGIQMVWESDRIMRVRFPATRFFQEQTRAEIDGRTVEIRLKKGGPRLY